MSDTPPCSAVKADGSTCGKTVGTRQTKREQIQLGPSQTKAKDTRYFPFAIVPGLKELLRAQWETRDGPFVFFNKAARKDGGRITAEGSFYTQWRSACKKAGLEGRTFHDLRRTAAMTLSVRGFDREEIKALCGWKTDAMFARYNIINAARLQRRAAQLSGANVKQTLNNEGTAAPTGPLS